MFVKKSRKKSRLSTLQFNKDMMSLHLYSYVLTDTDTRPLLGPGGNNRLVWRSVLYHTVYQRPAACFQWLLSFIGLLRKCSRRILTCFGCWVQGGEFLFTSRFKGNAQNIWSEDTESRKCFVISVSLSTLICCHICLSSLWCPCRVSTLCVTL